jgi:type IV pilus assembly protein PilA
MVAPTRPNPYAGPRYGGRPGGRPLAAAQIYQRSGVITLLAVLQFFSGLMTLLGGAIFFVVAVTSEGPERAILLGFGAVCAVLGILSILCGSGLWKLKGYGRTLQIFFSCIGLLAIPFGTVISALILVYLFKPGVKVLFSEMPPSQLSPADIAEVSRLSQTSGVTFAVMAVVVLFLLVAFVGMIAAIAIPSLLRARVSANEAQTLGDIRTVIAAQAAYSSSNGGHYDRLECLAKPLECLPGYSADGPAFLSEVFPPVRAGYHREFIGGLPADTSEVAFANLSPTSVQSFVYLAYPVSAATGVRGFCADYTGRICVTTDGSRPNVVDGQCDPACTLLE